MSWHESDLNLQKKFLELQKQKSLLYRKQNGIKKFETSIENLKMVVTGSDDNDPSKITYEKPKDNGGNEMNDNYREEQKSSLIVNIDEFLGNNDV